jgi:MFS family permease
MRNQGWRATGATIGTQAVQAGFLIYAFGTLAASMEPDLGTNRKAIMIAPACLSVATNLLFPYAGRLADRRPLKWLMLAGLAALIAGALALSSVKSVWQVYLIFGLLFPLANLFLGQLTASALVARWFDTSRGRALGISATGTSIGGFLFPFLMASLTARYGWRMAAVLTAGVPALLMVPVVLSQVREPPARAGVSTRSGTGWRELISQRAFWCETMAVAAGLFCYLGTLANFVPHAVASGLALTDASALMGLIALMAFAGKLGFGLLADRIDLRFAFGLSLACQAIAYLILASVGGARGLVPAAVMLGLAAGGLLPVWGALIARSFGAARVGVALGAMNLAMAPLTIMAAPYAGWLFDATGSYRPAFLSYLVVLATGGLALKLLQLPEQP